MSASPSTGPIAGERLLELLRARSILVVDLVTWPGGKRSVSIGFCPLSDRNPMALTRYVNIDANEIARVIGALETAGATIQAEAAK